MPDLPDDPQPTFRALVQALVCTTCTVKWFMEFKCIEVKCLCCYAQLEPKPAPQLITTLLKDIMVHCIACKRDINIKSENYHTHECCTSPTKGEMKMASQVLCQLADTSPGKCIIFTDGTVKYKSTHRIPYLLNSSFSLKPSYR